MWIEYSTKISVEALLINSRMPSALSKFASTTHTFPHTQKKSSTFGVFQMHGAPPYRHTENLLLSTQNEKFCRYCKMPNLTIIQLQRLTSAGVQRILSKVDLPRYQQIRNYWTNSTKLSIFRVLRKNYRTLTFWGVLYILIIIGSYASLYKCVFCEKGKSTWSPRKSARTRDAGRK